MSVRDLWKSLVRQACDHAVQQATRSNLGRVLRDGLEVLTKQQIPVRSEILGSAVVRAPEVHSASIMTQEGRLMLDVRFEDDEELRFSLFPTRVSFAPHGAKEIHFQVSPPELAKRRRIGNLVSAISGAIAHALWAMVLGEPSAEVHGAITERGEPGTIRVDLRTVPAVREIMGKGAVAAIIDVLEVASIRVEPTGLALEVRVPGLHK
ncbi:MAG: hypothetical protein AAF355_13270 [Myxococcota bacterium]